MQCRICAITLIGIPLKRLAPHRLKALILEDLERYPGSPISAIHRRIGAEISERAIKRALDGMIDSGHLVKVGNNRWTTYQLARSIDQPTSDGR